jgi:hypothetical protein
VRIVLSGHADRISELFHKLHIYKTG